MAILTAENVLIKDICSAIGKMTVGIAKKILIADALEKATEKSLLGLNFSV